MTRVLQLDRDPTVRGVNIALRVALVVAFIVALTVPLAALDGKAMGFRAPLFLAPVWIIAVIARIKRWEPYPYTAELLLVVPFLLDTLGNLFGLFEAFRLFDDGLHFVNWAFLVGAFHAFRFRNVFDGRDAVLLGSGFGALAIVAWELLEWAVSDDGFGGAGGLSLTYEDTVGDLAVSTLGGVLGSVLGVRWLGPTAQGRSRA